MIFSVLSTGKSLFTWVPKPVGIAVSGTVLAWVTAFYILGNADSDHNGEGPHPLDRRNQIFVMG